MRLIGIDHVNRETSHGATHTPAGSRNYGIDFEKELHTLDASGTQGRDIGRKMRAK